jgi:hypothetical protein
MSATSRLPAATTSGKNTMGCLVDGQLFVPQEPALIPYPYYTTTLSHYPADNLRMYWLQDKNSCDLSSIVITLDSCSLNQGITYALTRAPDTAVGSSTAGQWATYSPPIGCSALFTNYTTTAAVTGQVTITYYNSGSGIVSGTFWFDAIGPAGDTVHVREGRFDMTTQ